MTPAKVQPPIGSRVRLSATGLARHPELADSTAVVAEYSLDGGATRLIWRGDGPTGWMRGEDVEAA